MVVGTHKALQCEAEEISQCLVFGTTTCAQDSQKTAGPWRPQSLQQPRLKGKVEMIMMQMSLAELTKFGQYPNEDEEVCSFLTR